MKRIHITLKPEYVDYLDKISPPASRGGRSAAIEELLKEKMGLTLDKIERVREMFNDTSSHDYIPAQPPNCLLAEWDDPEPTQHWEGDEYSQA